MKRTEALVLLFLMLPSLAAAAFESDLYFGIGNSPEVQKLQEFLLGQDVYSGPATGNFLNLTRDGVINFQLREKIEPSLGYFGPKTRARANEILGATGTPGGLVIPPSASREEVIALINAKIAELTIQLQALQAKLSEEASSTPVATAPEPSPITPPSPVSVPAAVELRVSTAKTYTFPVVETIPLEIGEFKVRNGLSKDALLTHFEVLLSDEIDSTANRNRKVYFIIRDGLNAEDAQISKTEFTFILTPPKVGEPHKSFINLPFNARLKSGEEKMYSLWVEQFKYVRSGTLEIKTTIIGTTDSSISPVGGFDFILTKEPPVSS